MRVFLDTNVLVSAFGTRGLCADVVREVLGSHELIVSEEVLHELDVGLERKFGVSPELVAGVRDFLVQDSLLAKASDLPEVCLEDKDDVVILAAALNGQAEVFVTGDKQVLALNHIGSLEIVSPREFWDRIRTH